MSAAPMRDSAAVISGTGPAARAGGGWAVWSAGLIVVIAAGAATAHGLYVVALGSGTPGGIAWLYPVITDGLALVAYAATSRLDGGGRRYAWAVVVLAAGLSGLAQATYLAGALPPSHGAASGGGPADVAAAPAVLRFGVGAWPAVAAAIAAHLLFLIGTHRAAAGDADTAVPADGVPAVPSRAVPAVPTTARPPHAGHGAEAGPATGSTPDPLALPSGLTGVSQAERARAVARELAARTGALPTVRELAEAAQVGRGTANRALSALRATANGHQRPDPDGGIRHDPSQGAFWRPDPT